MREDDRRKGLNVDGLVSTKVLHSRSAGTPNSLSSRRRCQRPARCSSARRIYEIDIRAGKFDRASNGIGAKASLLADCC